MLELRDREAKAVAQGQELPPAYVIVSNQPYLFALHSTDFSASAFADGFKIPDFKLDQIFHSTHEMRVARDKHVAIHDLMHSMQVHDAIPTTFDGQPPELAFVKGEASLQIGQIYEIPDGDGQMVQAQLESASVLPPEKRAFGIYRTQDNRRLVVTCPLTDAEMAAWARHPETFFGVLEPGAGRKMRDPLDLYDFTRRNYHGTPKEKLLQHLKDAPDIERLKALSQPELVTVYAERFADAMYRQSLQSKQSTLSEVPPSQA